MSGRRRAKRDRRALRIGLALGLVAGAVVGFLLTGRGEASTQTAAPAKVAKQQVLGRQDKVLDDLKGSAKAACVQVGAERDVRSGGLGAGPFDTARSSFKPGSPFRLYVVPDHASQAKGVVLKAKNAATGKTVTVRRTDVDTADEFTYYDLQVTLPSAGTWTLRATSGPDQGCWTVTLP